MRRDLLVFGVSVPSPLPPHRMAPMNVGQLRKAIAHLPDDMPVAIQSECGWSELNLYVLDASIQHHHQYPNLTPWISEGHADTSRDYYKHHVNTTALLFSEWGNDGINLTPNDRPSVIDGEIAPRELTAPATPEELL